MEYNSMVYKHRSNGLFEPFLGRAISYCCQYDYANCLKRIAVIGASRFNGLGSIGCDFFVKSTRMVQIDGS
jgi:outer membrane protein W